ncbi:MAG: hypothetical protein AAGF26_02000 [Cyanobacteria bacterium P01_G01_bin.49]
MNLEKMTSTEVDLYKKICDFQLDLPGAVFPFSYKLAWEYQWTGIYTYRVIQEYKRFVFLAMVANHVVSPSTPVDRAWHLHLLYTHSYWDEFCGKILKKPLHHLPSIGGKQEGLKYRYYYLQTLETYQKYWGTPPPDIWNKPQLRGEKVSYQWLDRRQFWIIPKPKLFNYLVNWQKFTNFFARDNAT